ncbi:hypothetical protein FRB96_006667 [Tulasnella sp. 330]|nr:hypothetical protein FRB96_006667 [Tulasnella sp. 330]
MDDFRDLTWTNTSATTSTSPSTASSKPKLQASQYDSFSLLSASQSQRTTPNYLSAAVLPPSRSLTPSNQATTKSPVPSKASDAFSNLLNFGGGSSGDSANMSIAERQAKAEQEQRDKERKEKEVLQGQSAFWDSFEGAGLTNPTRLGPTSINGGVPPAPALAAPALAPVLRSTSSVSNRSTSGATKSKNSPAIPSALSALSSTSTSKPAPVTVWDFDLLGGSSDVTTTKPATTTSLAPQNDFLGEFDLLSAAPVASSSSKKPSRTETPPPVVRSNTPGDFDWGDGTGGGAGLLDEEESDNDQDILGSLGKPVKKSTANNTVAAAPTQRSSPSTSKHRATSPPPHVLGKLVEMGFSVQQAHEALAATDTGVDVEAAMDMLLARAAVDPQDESAPAVVEEDPRAAEEAARRRRQQERRRGGPSSRANLTPAIHEAVGDRPQSRSAEDDGSTTPDTLGHLADQADKVLAQASELGATLFSKANSLWSRANKAYVDTTTKPKEPQGSSNGSARPKWMVDQQALDQVSPVKGKAPHQGTNFRDEGDNDDFQNGLDVPPTRPSDTRSRKMSSTRQDPQHAPPPEVRVGSLFAQAPETSSSYVSPHRRKKGGAVSPTPITPSRNAPSPPLPKRRRVYVQCPVHTLADATARRTAGSAAYKLGQYADAELEFSAAINELPASHMGLIPLWNNRAMTRLKTGDTSGAVGDCTSVLDLIGPEWAHGDDNDSGGKDGPGVPLGDAAVKAMTRRAMAYEMGEKWDRAKEDWERLLGVGERWGPAGGRARAEAARGLERCRKITNPPPRASSQPERTTTAKAAVKKTPPVAVAVMPSGEASARLKAANAAAEAAETERYRVKDSVDARIITWKGGKENNVRALIASLENVLWPELGWVKVGMGELIMEQQVKVRYMKAISKLHPDKLRNATVEHQMIANGVFGALNDAYNFFITQK